jgi:hypothetical protein
MLIFDQFVKELDNNGYVYEADYASDPVFQRFLAEGLIEKTDIEGEYYYTLAGNPHELNREHGVLVKKNKIPGVDDGDLYSSESIEAILKYTELMFDAKVTYCDEVVYADGTVVKSPATASWYLTWCFGCMSLSVTNPVKGLEARTQAAIFMHLWRYHKIHCSLAEHLAAAWTNTYGI